MPKMEGKSEMNGDMPEHLVNRLILEVISHSENGLPEKQIESALESINDLWFKTAVWNAWQSEGISFSWDEEQRDLIIHKGVPDVVRKYYAQLDSEGTAE